MTTAQHPAPVRTDLDRTGRLDAPVRPSRRWALAGVVAGLAGVTSITASGMVGAVYDEALRGDPQGVADAVFADLPALLVFHTAAMIGVVATVLFAAGLHRRLTASAATAGSTAPLVAFAGLLGTATVTVVATGLDTEFMFAGSVPEGTVDPHAVVLFNHWVGTVPWCWVLAGLSGVAVWRTARLGAVPRWIGRVGLVLGGLTLLVGVSPLQYMAGMTGPIWLLVTAAGFLIGDRAFRAGR